jgi:hypothetical protein
MTSTLTTTQLLMDEYVSSVGATPRGAIGAIAEDLPVLLDEMSSDLGTLDERVAAIAAVLTHLADYASGEMLNE